MEKVIENFSEESLEDFLVLLEEDSSSAVNVKEEEMKKVCDIFVALVVENKLGFNFAKFMEFLAVTLSSISPFGRRVVGSCKNLVPCVLDLLKKHCTVEQPNLDELPTEYAPDSDSDETPPYYQETVEEEEEGEVINQKAEDGIKTCVALLEFMQMPNRSHIDETNIKCLSEFNVYLIDQMHDHNEHQGMKILYAHCVMSFTAILGKSEIPNVVNHKLQEDFYGLMLKAFNEGGTNMFDKVHFFSLLLSDHASCSKFLYPIDFRLVVQVIIRELKNNSEAKRGGLFEEYCACLMVILESKMFKENFEKIMADKIFDALKLIIEDVESTKNAVNYCKVVLQVLQFVMDE